MHKVLVEREALEEDMSWNGRDSVSPLCGFCRPPHDAVRCLRVPYDPPPLPLRSPTPLRNMEGSSRQVPVPTHLTERGHHFFHTLKDVK